MSHQATLYTVKKSQVVAGSYLEMFKYDQPFSKLNHVEGGEEALIRAKVEVDRIPIRVVYLDGQKHYYAFDLELQRIVNCLIREETSKVFSVAKDAGYMEGATKQKEEMQERFKNMSIFKRIICTLKGEIQ